MQTQLEIYPLISQFRAGGMVVVCSSDCLNQTAAGQKTRENMFFNIKKYIAAKKKKFSQTHARYVQNMEKATLGNRQNLLDFGINRGVAEHLICLIRWENTIFMKQF